ncbi:glycosyltransferase family 61 protein [Paracoccus sp. SSK6]|uniref:glycosyltransferase family 61 protein n=1 Tax=Paracoccus sp. SSK6 TaxID=3143131 RepID=UPI00321BD0BE
MNDGFQDEDIELICRIHKQPWPYLSWGKSDRVTRVLRMPPPPPQKITMPKVYGRKELPLADAPIKDIYEQKPLDLNKFEGCILLPGNVVLQDGDPPTVLNPSFYFGRHKWHGYMKRTSKDEDSYSYLKNIPAEVRHVPHPVYFADADHPKVYGHVLFDVIAKCWAYDHVPKNTPLATTVKMNRTYAMMLEALGMDPWNVIHIDRPTVVQSAYFPGITFGRRDGVYPQALEVYDKICRLRHLSDVPKVERLYISRTKTKGRKLGVEPEIERWFSDNGFSIVHPQDLKIEDQIALFSGAKMIAGTAGSAMHNAVFSPPETKILIIGSSGWLHLADIFISPVEGRLGYVFGDPFEPATDGHRTSGAWSVDIEDVKSGAIEHFGL